MDKIDKALAKLSAKESAKLLGAFVLIVAGQTAGLNIKKLKGHKDLYRLRVGDSRLVYRQTPGEKPDIIFVGKRNEQTYHNF